MGQEADQLRSDIRERRQHMSQAVDAIEDRVTPGRVVERQQARWRQTWTGLRDNVMGSRDYDERRGHQIGYRDLADDDIHDQGHHQTEGVMQSAQQSVQSLRDSTGEALSHAGDAPDAVMRQTKGNPLIAGAIAFGLGALVGSIAPTTTQERQAVRRMEPELRHVADDLRHGAESTVSEVQSAARDKADELKESAQQSAQSLKESAQESAAEVTDHAKREAQDVKDDAQHH